MASLRDWDIPEPPELPALSLDQPSLDAQGAELRMRSDHLDDDLRAADDRLTAVAHGLTAIVGRGTAESGGIGVEVDAQNRIVDLRIDARVFQLRSTEKLRAAILAAYDRAVSDAQGQLREAAGPEAGSPLDVFFELLPEVAEIVPTDVRHPPLRRRTEPSA